MKVNIITSLLLLMSVLVIVNGCSSTLGAENDHIQDIQDTGVSANCQLADQYLVDISAEEFINDAQISEQIQISAGESFIVILDSNHTTGFQWTEKANISDENIVQQISQEYLTPNTENLNEPVLSIAGVETWNFKAAQNGTSKIYLSYD